MVGSGKEPNKSIDATAGGLVWVRRRNGSWWPGKILGPDELPEGCMPTPRSGTPVKLLGREDSSFDWYNLEKSKRVKAFHCGEYDECIKKVMESVSHLPQKGAKYAQREDAILHALKLERARFIEENDDVNENLDISADDSNSESKQCRTPNDSENDDNEGVKRMRGLEDLGMGASPSLKKKRSQIAHVELLKRKNRHRPLTKVMASATMVSLPTKSEVKVFGLESDESKRNSSAVINTNSDCNGVSLLKDDEMSSLWEDPENGSLQKLFDVPLVAEEQHSAGFSSVISDASHPTCVNAKADSNQSSCLEVVSLSNEEHNRSDQTSSSTVNVDNIGPSTDKGSCEWRFKGKRNSRLRKVENEAETYVVGVDRETLLTASGRQLPYRQSRFTVNPKYDGSDFSLRRRVAVSGLYDVNVEVKTGYRAEHVPYISLMSKLTGRPVVGHPLTIEVLDECCEVEHRKLSSRSRSRMRKKSILSPKKTRKLSSLTGSGRGERKKGVVEKMKGPSVACVPLKVVFSRINAALSGSSVGMKS